MFHGDELVIGAKIKMVGRSSFTMAYRVERTGQPTAEGETVLICFDYTKRKPRRLDEGFRQKVEAFEKE
jgi:acyl-CoA thioester hydrolase